MKAMEELGLTGEKFDRLYSETCGFNDEFNKNCPSYGNGDSFESFLEDGSKQLINNNTDMMRSISLRTGKV